MLIYSLSICDYFCTTMAEVSHCDRDLITCKAKNSYPFLFRKSLVSSAYSNKFYFHSYLMKNTGWLRETMLTGVMRVKPCFTSGEKESMERTVQQLLNASLLLTFY